jgi:hypothetical protein
VSGRAIAPRCPKTRTWLTFSATRRGRDRTIEIGDRDRAAPNLASAHRVAVPEPDLTLTDPKAGYTVISSEIPTHKREANGGFAPVGGDARCR